MKTALIVILASALAGVAFFTRPSKESFDSLVKSEAEARGGSFAGAMVNGVKAEVFLNDIKYRDRYLWTTVANKEDQTIYVGALGHWFERGKVLEVHPQKVETVKIKLPV